MQPYPRAPDLVWPGHLHGTGCLSARAVGTGFPTVGLRLWLGPGCGWSWVLFAPARCGWGLGCVWARFVVLSLFCRLFVVFVVGPWCRPAFGTCVVSCAFPLPPPFPVPVCGVGVRAGPGSRLCPALLGLVVGLCFCAFLFFFFFFFSRCWVSLSRALWSLPPSPFFRAGLLASFFFFFLLVLVPLFPLGRCSWLGVAGFGWVVPLCLFGGPVFGAFWVGGLAPLCVFGGRFGGCVVFRAAPAPPFLFFFFFFGGGGGRSAVPPFAFPRLVLLCGWCVVWLVPRHSWRRFLCATPRHSWLGFAAGGGGRSPPLLAGVCRRRWCVVCGGGVALVCWWGCGCCVVWLVPRHSWQRFLCATPCHSWLGFAAAGGGRSPPLLAGVLRRWCVAVVCWWGCGWCVVWLVPRHSWRRFLCATPRHSWLGFAAAGGGRSPPLLAGVRLRRCVWCVVCGGGVLVGLWLVCGVVGPSPLLAEVPVCYSPPLLAGFRYRWWWAVPATPGWGPLVAVVCGVWRWCVAGVVAGVWCGWSLATPGGGSCVLLPATPGWVSLPLVVGGPRHSWLGSAGGVGVWCVAVVCCWGCGWCVVWLVPRHSWRRSLCATPRHSWLGFAAAGGGRSPPLLAGDRWRRGCVVCGVLLGSLATPGGGSCVLLPATPGWVSLPLVVGIPATPGWGPLAAVVCVLCLAGLGGFVFLLCLAPSGLGLPLSLSLLLPFLVGWGLWCVGWLLPGTCSCAVVRCVLCVLSGFVAPGGRRCLAPVRVPWLWPAACLSGVPRGPAWCAAPRPVRSLSVLRLAFPTPWCLSPPRELAPPALLGGCAGHAEAESLGTLLLADQLST